MMNAMSWVYAQLATLVGLVVYHWSGVVGKGLRRLWLCSPVHERVIALLVVACLRLASPESGAASRDLTIHGYRMIALAASDDTPLTDVLTG